MLSEPTGEGVHTPVGQNVHQRMTFEIHQDRPVAGSPAESEVVHTQDPRRFVIPEPQRADMVQQGISGNHDDPEVFQKAGACFSSEGEGDVREPAVEPLGPASVMCSDAGQPFCEDRLIACCLVAEESSEAQVNVNGNSLPGQVGQCPRIPGVDSCGSLSARRTTSCTG
jgi:hypothetical protein